MQVRSALLLRFAQSRLWDVSACGVDEKAIALSAALEIVECDRVARGVHIAFLGEERTHL
jgi:hypothetical protein